MNTTTQAPTATHLEAYRAEVPPYLCGVLDAQAKRPCRVDDYAPWEGEQASYVAGYKEEAEAMLAEQVKAQRFEQMLRAMVGEDEVEAMLEVQEYTDDMLDREWHSRGMW